MMKRLLILLIFVMSAFLVINACDFSFSVNGNIKSCHPGDIIEVKVVLTLTHRVCNVAASQTKFKIDGIKVLSASTWKQTGATTYERTVKMEVLNDGKKKVMIIASRSCDKEGGTGSFVMPKQ
jgi:hypothetical protein